MTAEIQALFQPSVRELATTEAVRKRLEIVRPPAGQMGEAELQEAVEQLCRLYYLPYHHCGDSRLCQGGGGFPDLVIVGPLGVLWRELKVADRNPTFDQHWWGRKLITSGQDWAVWTDQDYASGRITCELAAIGHLAAIGQLPAAA